MAVNVDGSSPTFQIGNVEKLFEINPFKTGSVYDVTKDGQKFIVNSVLNKSDKSKVVLVKNWDKDLEK